MTSRVGKATLIVFRHSLNAWALGGGNFVCPTPVVIAAFVQLSLQSLTVLFLCAH